MKTKTKLSFQQLLDQTKRVRYIDKVVVSSVEPCEPQELEFFKVGKDISDDELDKEYAQRDLEPAHPYALALYSKEHEDVMEEKVHVGTHWKDAKGNWCFATFNRWYGRRGVSVSRDDFGWSGHWWFAGRRKDIGIAPLTPNPLTLDSAIKMVLKEGYVIYKPVLSKGD